MKNSRFLFSTLFAAAALSVAPAIPALADGDGTSSSPLSGTISGLNPDSYTGTSGVVYINGITGGYWAQGSSDALTIASNIDISGDGMTLTDGYSDSVYTFTGNITGNGSWTHTTSQSQKYIFTGSLAGYSGSITDTGASGSKATYIYYGNGGTAATDTNVSGTGSVTVNGEIAFNYSGYADPTSQAIAIANSSLTASTITFTGSVNYTVSSNLAAYNTSSTLTFSNSGTTTLKGSVTGFKSVTVGSSTTLAFDGSVSIGSAITNEGTVSLNSDVVFLLDDMDYTGNWEEGATYTLISGGTILLDNTTLTSSSTISLGTSNLYTGGIITSASFNYDGSSLTVTVTGDSIVDGLNGAGTADNPYFTYGTTTVSFDVSKFPSSGTIYLATDTRAFGNSSENIYWSGPVTATCDIVIGAAGIYLTNGTSSNVHTFSGKISGTGDWTVTYYGTGTNQGAGVTQHYVFTGDLSGWSGSFTIATPESDDYVYFGDGNAAVTNTNVTGTGNITVDTGTVRFNYSNAASGGDTIAIGNQSVEANIVEFTGAVNYAVSSTLRGSSSSSTLIFSNSGTTTVSGSSISGFGSVTVSEGTTLVFDGAVSIGSAIENSGTVTLNDDVIFALNDLEYTGDISTGATFTLISGSGEVTGWENLSLDNVSYTYVLESADFNYSDGTLTVTVVASGQLATTVLPTGTQSSESPTASSGVIAQGNYKIGDNNDRGWISPWPSGGAGSDSLSFEGGTTFSGKGLLGIFVNQGSGSTTETIDLTNVTANDLSGQLIVLNNWNNPTLVKIAGDSWSNVEYLFGGVADDIDEVQEKYGLTGQTRGDLNSDFTGKVLQDTLELDGNTTFAGVTGATQGTTVHDGYGATVTLCDHEFITAASNGTTLTIVGNDEYGFYGTVGTASTAASIVMNSADGTGSQTFGGTNYLQNVTVTSGTLTLGNSTVSGTITVSGEGATLVSTGNLSASTLAISEGATITLSDDYSYDIQIFNLGENVDLEIANLSSTSITKQGAGSLSITGSVSASTISVAEGSLTLADIAGSTSVTVWEGAALTVQKVSTSAAVSVTLEGGTLSALGIDGNVTVSVNENSTLDGVSLTGGTIAIADETVVTLTGEVAFTSGAVDLSDFFFTEEAVNVFDVSNLSSSDVSNLVDVLNSESITKTVDGLFGTDSDGYITFTATNTSLSWDTSWSDKTWSQTKFGDSDREVSSSDSAVFGTLDGLEEIQIVGDVYASSVMVKASDSGTYVFYDGSLELSGTLTVSSGTLELETALSTKNIQIRGGTLVVTNKGSATATGEVSIRSGTLRVESAGTLTASQIEMTGGELAFVSGALDNVDEISLSAGSANNPATLTWISGNTDNSILQLLTVSAGSYVCFNIESGVVDTNDLGAITLSDVSANYIKTGAGELQLSQWGMLKGSLTIYEGTVAFTIATSEVGGSFSGDITVSGSNAILRVDNDDVFESSNTITILDGGTLQLGYSDGSGIEEVDIYGVLTLGDGAQIIDAQSYSGGEANRYYVGLYMTSGSSIVVQDNSTATINALVALGQTTEFNVGTGSTLTVSRITYVTNESGESYGITKTGTGKLILQSSNQSSYYADYTGTTTVREGTFSIVGAFTLAGDVVISSDATLEVDAGGSTVTITGVISGSGNIQVTSGTATITTGGISGSDISTRVEEGATLLFGNGVNYSGDLYLAGALGGSGNGTKTFSGSLTLTDTATFVGTTFTLSGTLSKESSTTIRVVGGDLIIANANLGATDYEVTSRGILEASAAVSADSVTLSGGTITSTGRSGSWEINNLVIDSGSNGLAGNVTIADETGTGTVTLTLEGALQIGGDLTGLSKADGTLSTDGTLIIAGSSRNGSLTISYTYETDQDSGDTIDYYGELSVGELVLSADYSGSTTITLEGGILTVATGATFEQAVNITGSGTFNAAGTISFQGLNESTIQGGNLVVAQDAVTTFDVEERATISSAIWNEELTLNATETDEDGNETTTTVTTYILAEGTTIRKTGDGTLVLNRNAVQYFSDTRSWGDNIEVTDEEPDHYFTANIVVEGGTLWINSGSGALGGSGDFTVDNATLYVADGIDKTCGSISLTNGATLTAGSGGNGVVTVGGNNGEQGSLTALDATINGTVQLSSAGDFVLGGVTINGSLELGSSGNGGDGIAHLTIDGSFGGITISGSLSIKSTDVEGDNANINISLTNVGAIGAEYVLIESTSRNGISLSDDELNLIKLSDTFKLEGDNRNFVVEVSNGNLVVKAYGTLVWNDATEWADDSEGWLKTAVNGNTSSTFSTGDYVDFQFSGSDTTKNIIAVGEGGVSVGGAAFNGADSNSIFVVNFESSTGILASTTADAQTAVSINSGTVIFEGGQGVEGVNHTFNAGLYITSGATLQVDTLVNDSYKLGTGAISLGGTLSLTYTGDENTISNDISVTTASSAISVGTNATATLAGKISGDGVLNKLGDGTLNLTAENTSVYGISVAAGTMNIGSSETESDLDVSAIEVASGATLNLTDSVTLSGDTELYISGTATFEASGSKLGTLVMTDGALMSVAEGGGYFSIDSNASFSVSGEATIDAGLELVFGDDASLSIYVASGGKLTVTGDVVDNDDEEGSFTITKSGAGELAFDSYWNDADLVFTAGTISFNDFAEVSGNINATGSGLVMNFALSGEDDSFIGTEADGDDPATTFAVSGSLSINVTGEANESGEDRKLVILGNLSATTGTINISTEDGTKVVIDGVTNTYNTIYVLENSKLEIGSDVESFSGTLLQLAGGATLEVSAALTESSGGLRVGDYTTISFTGEGTSIAFSTFSGLNTTSTYDLTVTGSGTLIIGDGYAGTNNINNLVITIDKDATFQNAGTMLAGTFAGDGTVENTGTMTITKASDSFTGTLLITSGAVQISETTSTSGSRVTATGSMANATAEIKEEGSLVIGISSDAAIGNVDGATTVVGSASGEGSIIILNTELFFGESSLEDFTGTLAAIAGTINYGTVAAQSGATAIVIGGEYEGGSYSGRLNVNEEELSEVSIGSDKSVSVSNGFITVAEDTTLTISASSFTASGAVYFDGEGDTIVSSSITNATEGASLEIVVTDGTVTLSGDNEQTLTSVYSPGKVIFGSTGSLGTDDASVALYGGTVRFEGEFGGTIDTAISGTGTIEGASTATISGISSSFTGYILATNDATVTIEKDTDSLSTATVFFGADKGATLVISTANVEDETTFGDGSAYFYGDGTIRFDIGEGKTLQITNSSLYDEESGLSLSATIEVTSGTLQIGSSAYVGTGNINLSRDSTLLFTDRSTLGNNVTGNGTVTKRGAGTTSYINALSANANIESGTLSITSTSDSKITMTAGQGAILELSQVWDDEKLAYVDRDTAQTFTADYVVSGDTGSVTFSHSASTGYSIVDGTLTAGDGNTIVLSGGGEGSYFSVAVDSAAVQKIGTGKWILTDYSSSAGITVDAGTLVIQNYAAGEDQSINIKSNATLEIDSFKDDAIVTGTITGSGILLIADTTVEKVTLDLSDDSGSDWTLMVGASTTVEVVSDISNNITLNSGSTLSVYVAEDEETTLSGFISTVDGSTLTKTGAGDLVIDNSSTILYGSLDVEEGSVTVKTDSFIAINQSSSNSSKITVAEGADLIFALSDDATAYLRTQISGSGTIEVQSGTVEFYTLSGDFEGTIQIDGTDDSTGETTGPGTVIFTVSMTNFGGSINIDEGGTLRIQSGNTTLSENISGSGTIVIAHSSTSSTTTYAESDFEGTFEIESGGLKVSATDWTSLKNEVVLTGGSNASLIIENSEGDTVELSDNDNVSSTTGGAKISLEGGKFYIGSDDTFGTSNTILSVSSGATLGVDYGATINSGLYVANGATFELGIDDASAVGTLSTLANTLAADATGGSTVSVSGTVEIYGTMKAVVPDGASSDTTLIHSTDAATIGSAATIIFKDANSYLENGTITLVASDTRASIASGSAFITDDGVELRAIVSGNSIQVGQQVKYSTPSGLGEFVSVLDTDPNSDIYGAIWHEGGDQRARLLNFSPVSFGALSEITMTLVRTENDLLRQRLEQRRYDIPYDTADAVKGFINAIGGATDTDKGKDKNRNYNISHFGAVAGMDGKISSDLIIGASLSYDSATAKIHNSGGKHTADITRFGVYGMYMLDEVSYIELGASLGFSGYDTKRENALETVKGDTSGTDFSISATVGRMFVISSHYGLHLAPYIGLDYSYDHIADFSEDSADTAFDIDSMDRNSLRGLVGATLNWVPTEEVRLGLELTYAHEFLDTDQDIDAEFSSNSSYRGQSFTSTAYFADEDTISVGPRIEFRLDENWAINAGYTFQTDFDGTTAHSGNVGVRCRF